jgi:hypothetical protein
VARRHKDALYYRRQPINDVYDLVKALDRAVEEVLIEKDIDGFDVSTDPAVKILSALVAEAAGAADLSILNFGYFVGECERLAA